MDSAVIDLINVLIVEPDSARRTKLIACLPRERGFAVVSAGEDFLAAAVIPVTLHLPVDVLLINIDAPEMRHADVWAAIHLLLPHARIAALTAESDEYVLRSALGAGVRALHPLDIDSHVLQRMVRNTAEGGVDFDPQLKNGDAANLLRHSRKAETGPAVPAVDVTMLRSNNGEQMASLTPREFELVWLIAQGRSNREIAEQLHLSEKTVRNYVSHILDKLELSNRTQVAVWMRAKGLS